MLGFYKATKYSEDLLAMAWDQNKLFSICQVDLGRATQVIESHSRWARRRRWSQRQAGHRSDSLQASSDTYSLPFSENIGTIQFYRYTAVVDIGRFPYLWSLPLNFDTRVISALIAISRLMSSVLLVLELRSLLALTRSTTPPYNSSVG